MKFKKYILFLLLAIIAIVAYFSIEKNPDKTNITYDFSYREFAVKNADDIGYINLYNRNGTVINLSKINNNWMVNGKYNANMNLIKNLLSVIENIKIDYTPPEVSIPNIIKGMSLSGIKVEILDKNKKLIKCYYVGGSPQDSNGTYFLMDKSSSPLVMTIPGFTGNLKVRFTYSLDEWRDRTVYNIAPSEIVQANINYFFAPDKSFILTRNGNSFIASNPSNPNKSVNIGKNKAETYLLGYQNKSCEYIENSMPDKDIILSRPPIAEINLKLKNAQSKKLEIFQIPDLDDKIKEERQGIDKYINDEVFRYIAKDEKGDLFLIQYEVFKDIFVTFQWFDSK